MASRNIDDLERPFKKKVRSLIGACSLRGYTMVAYCTVRTPQEQGALWRRGRSTSVIDRKVKDLRDAGCHYLANCIAEAGPQVGSKVTQALPGESWHQYGLAVDFYYNLNGKAVWGDDPSTPGNEMVAYQVMADEAVKLGLDPGGLWSRFTDWPHVQATSGSVQALLGGLVAIDRAMEDKFGE